MTEQGHVSSTTAARERLPISEAEKKLSYSKYYYMDLPPIPENKAAVLAAGPCDPKDALPIHDRNRLFEPGYLPIENGYCTMEDGTGFMACLTPMPGVTAEMFDWWMAWHANGPLRYTIWNPYEHKSAVCLNYGIVNNAALSYKERYWDTVHLLEEDVGGGAFVKLALCLRQPKHMGFDAEKIGTEACSTIVCGNSGSVETGVSTLMLTHFLRPVDGGSELRTRFWFGWQMIAGRPVKFVPDGQTFPKEIVRGAFNHCAIEFNHLAHILPSVFAEEHEKL